MRRLLVAAVLAVLAAGLAPAPAFAAPGWHPSALAVGGARQVVVVTAPSWSSTTGTLRAFERDGTGDEWREVVGPTPADLGWSGLVPGDRRRQGTGKTPTGTYALTSAFGRATNPGTTLPYRRIDRDDRWTFDPKSPSTYNVLQPAGTQVSGLRGEHLWGLGRQYDYVAVMDFNLPSGAAEPDANGVRRVADGRANTRMGGAIFLHVTKGEPTAGCVAVPRERMRAILQWLDPAKHPVIVTQVASLREVGSVRARRPG